MMKNEIKIEYRNSDKLLDFILNCYSEEKLIKKDSCLIIDDSDLELVFLKSITNATIKMYNQDLLDGYIRFIVESDDNIKLYPISIFYTQENTKYFFY